MRIQLKLLTLAAAVSTVVLTGCQYPNGQPNNTASGALIGGAMGAFAGAVIGGPEHGGAGALIGAAAGALTGSAIGNSIDQQQAAELRAQAPQTYVRVQQGQPLTISDIKALAQANVSDDVIISQIRSTQTVFHLSASDIIELHDAGVSSNVINFMINTPNSIGQADQTTTVVATAPPPPPTQPVILAPGPGYVWIGGEWVWNGHWLWRAGYWSLPPYPHAVWIGGYWHRGPDGWHRRSGHWR